jgi:hypothetical protein
MPKNLNVIGCFAFDGCDFEQFDMPDTVVSIEEYAFMDCFLLQKIRLSKDLRRIGCSAFQNCMKLQKPAFPKSLNFVGMEAFLGTLFGEKKSYMEDELEEENNQIDIKFLKNAHSVTSDIIKKFNLTLKDEQ